MDSQGGKSRDISLRSFTELPDVVISVPKIPRGPGKIEDEAVLQKGSRRAYVPFDQYTQEEAILHLLSHEMRHLWQARVPKGWRVWGSRGQYSERDCDAYAIRVVRHWRRTGSPFYGSKGEVR